MKKRMATVAVGLLVSALVVTGVPGPSAMGDGGDTPPPVTPIQPAVPGVKPRPAASPDMRVMGAGGGADVTVAGVRGDFSAAKLSPVGSWSATGATGGFTYQVPFRIPEVAGGTRPEVALSYASQAVDGLTTATNNQPSVVGEGWSLGTGFVQRRYVGCADDVEGSANNKTRKTGDLCWFADNAVLSFGGVTSELVKKSGNEWRLRQDDGSRIQRLTGARNGDNDGEYWVLTTPDGTKVYFGRGREAAKAGVHKSVRTVPVFGNHPGEPGHKKDFASSSTRQAYQWDVDHVVDVHGNAMSYFYGKDTNRYGQNRNTVSGLYVRDSWLERIEYGMRANSAKPAAVVKFSMTERCVQSAAKGASCPGKETKNAASWPDVPLDLVCTSGKCGKKQQSPAFFSTRRLSRVSTWVNGAEVERWDLRHSFPDPRDLSAKALWLSSVTHSAAGGKDAEPAMHFDPVGLPNRVDWTKNSEAWHANTLIKHRVATVRTPSGGHLNVIYKGGGCDGKSEPKGGPTGRKLCFPVWWVPPHKRQPIRDWFNTYVVTDVAEGDTFGFTGVHTRYEYHGSPGWGYTAKPWIPAKRRVWSQWLGYERITTIVGPDSEAPQRTETRYFRGRHGEGPAGKTITATVVDSQGGKTTDARWLRGQVRETRTLNGAAVVSSTIHDHDASRVTAGSGRKAARTVVTTRETERRGAEKGKAVTVRKDFTHDARGFVTRIDDRGDVADAGDDRCTQIRYAHNAGGNVWGKEAEKQVQSGACSTWSATAKQGKTVEWTRTYFDGSSTLGKATKGDPTRVSLAKEFKGSTAVWVDTTSRFDAMGREISRTDPLKHTTTFAFAPATSYTPTELTQTSADPDGAGPLERHVTKLTLDARFGTPVKMVEPGKETTEAEIDSYGRITSVWAPGALKSRHPATTKFTYHITDGSDGSTHNAITTERSVLGGKRYKASVELYDGWWRKVQNQDVTRDEYTNDNGAILRRSGRITTTTVYDSRGLVRAKRGPLFTSGAPENTFVQLHEQTFPSATRLSHDGAGRMVKEERRSHLKTLATTVTGYGGDRVLVDPPAGGVRRTTLLDAHGKPKEVWDSTDGALPGPNNSLRYRYRHDAAGRLVGLTDPRGTTWLYTHDLLGNRVGTVDPDTGKTSAVFDSAGRETSSTDGNGTTLTHTYDALGRKLSTSHGSTTLSEWVYDTKKVGHISSIVRHLAGKKIITSHTKFDKAGRVLTTSTSIPEIPGWVPKALSGEHVKRDYYYRDGTNDQSRWYPAGAVDNENLHFFFDWDLGRPTGAKGEHRYFVEGLYDALNRPVRFTSGSESHPNWLSTSYDPATNLVSSQAGVRNQQGTFDVETRYVRDAALNITGIHTNYPLTGGVDHQCVERDQLQRITQVWTPSDGKCTKPKDKTSIGGVAPSWRSWTYDASYNKLTDTDHLTGTKTSWKYPAASASRPHAPTTRTTGSKAFELGYDKRGNTTSRTGTPSIIPGATGGSTAFVYNPENRVEKATSTAGTHKTAYWADGTRMLDVTADGTTTVYIGDTEHSVAADGTLTTRRHIKWHGKNIALRVATKAPDGTTTDKAYTLWPDHHNTAVTVIDQGTNELVTRHTDILGGTRGKAVELPHKRGFVHGINNPALSITHIGDRDYDPHQGVFLQPDRLIDLSDPGTWNPYAYGSHNHVNVADPTGYCGFRPESFGGGIGLGGGHCSGGGPGRGGGFGSSLSAAYRSMQKRLDQLAKQIQSIGKRTKPGKPDTGGKPKPGTSKRPPGTQRPQCFVAGTRVLLADGTSKAIETIKNGDKVETVAPDGSRVARKVVHTFTHTGVATYRVTLRSGATLTTTEDHPFWVNDRGWTAASHLLPGDTLRTADRRSATIAEVQPTGRTETVYNFEVEGTHSYFVSANGQAVWVHNKCRKQWTLTDKKAVEVLTQKGTNFRYFRMKPDRKGKTYWWTKDGAKHGGSQFKVYTQEGRKLVWYKDADKYGNFIEGKFKGMKGRVVDMKSLHGSRRQR